MPGLSHSNELISRDEGLHTRFACLLFKYIIDKPATAVVHDLIEQAVSLEKAFARGVCIVSLFHSSSEQTANSVDSIPVALIGMNADMMDKYIEFVADHLLSMLGYSIRYNAVNPVCPVFLICAFLYR